MAKGGYFVIGHPDEHDGKPFAVPDDIIAAIQKTHGEVAYILHDRDQCKAHYHFLIMWEKSPKDWEWFVDFMMHYNLYAPDRKHQGATWEENRYCKREAVVRDVDKCLEYMLHPELYEPELYE